MQVFGSLRAAYNTIKGRHSTSLLRSLGHLICHEIPPAHYSLRNLRLLLVVCCRFRDVCISTSQRLLISIHNSVDLDFAVDTNNIS